MQWRKITDRVVLCPVGTALRVLTRSEAPRQFRLMPDRIGDMFVLGDRDIMFGDLQTRAERLPPTHRAHGSLHEMDLPLTIYDYLGPLAKTEELERNFQLAGFLYR